MEHLGQNGVNNQIVINVVNGGAMTGRVKYSNKCIINDMWGNLPCQ
jgi:hypothetical protein